MVITIASCCVAVDTAGGTVRIALGSVGPTVLRCEAAEEHLAATIDVNGGGVDAAALERAIELVRDASRPIDDHRASAEYRRHAVGVLAGRLLRRAFPAG